MKKYVIIVCLITLWGCSKNENIPLIPDNSIEVSHITNDDLALVDGYIQLVISKEEAIERGVPASEYDLVEETLIKHNRGIDEMMEKTGKKNVQTKSERYGNTMAFGMLQDPSYYYINYVCSIPLCVENENNSGGIILNYTFSSDGVTELDRHILKYHFVGYFGGMGEIEEYGYTIGDLPFPGFTSGSAALEYNFYGNSSYGICIYQIFDNT